MPQNKLIRDIKSLFYGKEPQVDERLLRILKEGKAAQKAAPVSWSEMRKMTEQGDSLLKSSTPWAAKEIASAYVCGNEEDGFLAMITNAVAYSYLYTKTPSELADFLLDPGSFSGKSIVFGTNEFCHPKTIFTAFEENAKQVVVENTKLCAGISEALGEIGKRRGTRDMRYTLEMIFDASRKVAAHYQERLHENERGRQLAREKYPFLAAQKVTRDRMKENLQYLEEMEKKTENRDRHQKKRTAR